MQKVKFSALAHILAYLHAHRNKKVMKTDISKDLDITYSHVNSLIALLERKGLITGEKHGKYYYVQLADKAMEGAKSADKMIKLEG